MSVSCTLSVSSPSVLPIRDLEGDCWLLGELPACPSEAVVRRCEASSDFVTVDDLRRRCPLSTSSERLPSMPSLVTPKKKFFGYMCLSIMCSRRFE